MGLFKQKQSKTVQVKGNDLVCPVCGNNHFYDRKAQLNTSLASFFGLDWANRSAVCFVCSNCTHIMWFLG
jgi:predicted nucleic-acid-binding Zn-ribbon protein